MQVKLYMIIGKTEYSEGVFCHSYEVEYTGWDGANLDHQIVYTYFKDFEKDPSSNKLVLLTESEMQLLKDNLHQDPFRVSVEASIQNLELRQVLQMIYAYGRDVNVDFKEVLINL